MDFFDLRTAYLITALMYLIVPVATWSVLAAERTRSAVLWCAGGLLNGIATWMAIFPDPMPVLIYKPLIRVVMCIGILCRIQSLLLLGDKSIRVRTSLLIVVANVLFFEIQRFFFDERYTQVFAFLFHALLYGWLFLTAFWLYRRGKGAGAILIGATYLIINLLLIRIQTLIIQSDFTINFLSPHPAFIALAVVGVISAFMNHIGYVGMVLEGVRARELEAVAARTRSEVTHRLGEQVAQLQRQKVLGEMSSTLAHELSQPLTVVLSSAQLARRAVASAQLDQATIGVLLDRVISGSQRIAQIIDRIRTYIRPSTLTRKATNLGNVVADVVEMLVLDVDERKALLNLRLPPRPIWVTGDFVQLSQILLNVVRNALESGAYPPGRQPVLIELLQDGDQALIRVSDAGPGFTQEALEQASRSFFTTKPDGLGLGLPISSAIASQHGGTLTWRNAPQGGAVVELRLPLLQTPELETER